MTRGGSDSGVYMNPSIADAIVEFFKPLFSTWGYLLVLGGAFFESIFLTGWLAPGTTVVLLAGFYAAQGELSIIVVGVCAALGAFLGDNVGYFMGSVGGNRLLARYGDRKRLSKGLEKTENYFRRYGGATVLFGRLLSGVDAFIPLAAGLGSMRYRRYVACDIPGILFWVGILCTIGYLFGENWETIGDIINYLGWGLLGLVIAVAAVYYLVKRRRKRKAVVAR